MRYLFTLIQDRNGKERLNSQIPSLELLSRLSKYLARAIVWKPKYVLRLGTWINKRILLRVFMGFLDSSVGRESTCNAGDPGSIPGPGRSAREGIVFPLQYSWSSLVAQLVRNPPAIGETWVWSLGWEDPLEKGTTYPLQYSGLENSMNCIVHRVAKSWTQLSDFHLHLQEFLEYGFICLFTCHISVSLSESENENVSPSTVSPALWEPMDYSPPDSSVLGILPGVGCHFLLQEDY